MKDADGIAADLLALAGVPVGRLSIEGAEPVLGSSFRVDAAAAAAIGASGVAAAAIHAARGGGAQDVAIALRHAAAEFRSEHHARDAAVPAGEMWDPIAGLYPTGDGGHVRLHTNFPHHRDGIVALLGCGNSREAVGRALLNRQAEAFETAATARGMCVAALRSFAQWDAHPHAAVLPDAPLAITRIGRAPRRALPPAAARPLQGVRVLELARVLAGPVAGRTLAAHGAEVLHITGPGVPNLPRLIIDTGRGKRAAALDLNDASGRARLAELAVGADVFLQSYRSGALAARGFGPEDLAARNPGIVVGAVSAYGETGPWGGKRGFDSLVQTATGFNDAEAAACGEALPRPLPCQALDHASGTLLALGIAAALLRRHEEGGSWNVTVSLAATAKWLRNLGRVADGFRAAPAGDVSDLLETQGSVTAVRHAARLSATPAFWSHPAELIGTSPAEWMASQG